MSEDDASTQQTGLELIEEGDEENTQIEAVLSPSQQPSQTAPSLLPSPGDELEADSAGGSAHRLSSSRLGSQPRLPSQAGRAALARTPGLTDSRNQGLISEDEDFDLGRPETGASSSTDEDSEDEEQGRRRSFLITEVKDGGGQTQWEGMQVQHRAADSDIEDDDEDRESDWDTDLELDAETKKIMDKLDKKNKMSIEDDTESEEEEEEVEEDEHQQRRPKPLPEHDPTGRTLYSKVCERLGVVPVSYFARHITDPEIIMRFHGLGPHGTRAIARVLRQIVTCEKLNLSGNWMEWKGGMHMARTIMENDYISELIIADNQLGSVGGYHFAKMLENNNSLKKLDLSGNDFVDSDAEHFAEAIESNKYLKELNLSRNHFGAKGGEILGPAIGSNDVLDSLDLSWNKLRKSGAVAVAKGLKENIRLKTCNLSWNGFGDEGGAALADALAQQESLSELDISGNRLGGQVAFALAKALKSNEEIRTLKLGNNPLTTSGAISITKALSDSESSVLVYLDLSECPVEFEFMRTVKEIESKRSFKVLHGPVMRSGNTTDDIGKPAIDPYKLENPLLVLKEHIVVNDLRIIDRLKEYDTESTFAVSQEHFAMALEDLGVPFTKDELTEIAEKLDKNKDGTIYYGDIAEQLDTDTSKEDTAQEAVKLNYKIRPITVE